MICTSPERCALLETGGGVTRLRLVPTGVYGSDSNSMAPTGALDILMRKRCTNRPRVAQVVVCYALWNCAWLNGSNDVRESLILLEPAAKKKTPLHKAFEYRSVRYWSKEINGTRTGGQK